MPEYLIYAFIACVVALLPAAIALIAALRFAERQGSRGEPHLGIIYLTPSVALVVYVLAVIAILTWIG